MIHARCAERNSVDEYLAFFTILTNIEDIPVNI